MPPTSTPQSTTSSKEAAAQPKSNSVKTGRVPVTLKLLGALFIPPLGLILAVVAALDKKRPKRLPLTIVLLIATALGVLGYLTMFTGLINVKIPGIDKTKYTYQDTGPNGYSTEQSAGMSFSKPSQFTSTAKKSGSGYSTQSFVHFDPDKYPLAYIFTFSQKDKHTTDTNYIKGVSGFMSGAVKNSYSTQYMDGIKKQVFDSYPGYNATLGAPQKFTNANIKQNAWSFDLDITNSNPQIKPMKGKLVYVLGNGTICYFSLMVTQANWTPNMATWQTVLGSLKINA